MGSRHALAMIKQQNLCRLLRSAFSSSQCRHQRNFHSLHDPPVFSGCHSQDLSTGASYPSYGKVVRKSYVRMRPTATALNYSVEDIRHSVRKPFPLQLLHKHGNLFSIIAGVRFYGVWHLLTLSLWTFPNALTTMA